MALVETPVRRKRLVLIEPYPADNPYRMRQGEMKAIWFPKLSLPAIASHTPAEWDIRLIDESVQEVDYETPADLVGISAMTCYAPRAYEIAAEFRKRGVKVVLGGVHASYCPEEALQHVDTVVIGEAEELWPRLLKDFQNGGMERVYKMERFPDLSNYPRPRIDLLPRNTYMTSQCVFTTRGCHFDCEFCSVSPFNGKMTRRRPVGEVCEEIRRIKESRYAEIIERLKAGGLLEKAATLLRLSFNVDDASIFAFVDDLHNSNRTYCKELWTALKDLNIKWGAQTTLFLGDDRELVKLAAESGCVAVFVGMESISDDSLEETNKSFNQVKKFEDEIRMFHDHGIMVNPGMVFGFDHDDESIFERTVNWLIKNRLELAYFNILTPLPGTTLFERYEKEGVIIDRDWSHYDGKHVVYRPKKMTPEVLLDGFFWANREFYSLSSIAKRISSTSQRVIPRLYMNWQFRRLIYRTTPPGALSPIGKIIQGLDGKIPSRAETAVLIPNALHSIRKTMGAVGDQLHGQIDQFLEIHVDKHEKLQRLLVDLRGTLDRINAKKARAKVLRAIRNSKMEIVINFEHLKHATPAAIETLLDCKALKRVGSGGRLKVMNLQASFRAALKNFTPVPAEVSPEEWPG